MNISNKNISIIALVISNLVPLFGVLFWNWSLFNILFLYWLESAIIGFFNILKMRKIGGDGGKSDINFFILHYGGFMAGHFGFLYIFFSPNSFFIKFNYAVLRPFEDIPEVGLSVIFPIITVLPAFISLLLSHGVSYYKNFIGNKEYLKVKSLRVQMMKPYSRIVLMHLVLFFGGFGVMFSGNTIPVLVILIFLKMIFDISSHNKEHLNNQLEIR